MKAILALALLGTAATGTAQEAIESDVLVVGGNESAVAAAVQAARLGVKRVVLVNDIDWLGGQFSAEAVGAIDEWTDYGGRRVYFPRSGMFLEVLRSIERHNGRKYGVRNPGNAGTADVTVEPAVAAQVFEELLAPYGDRGSRQIRVVRRYRPAEVRLSGNRVAGVVFEPAGRSGGRIEVRASITIDASEWGDVIQRAGAAYAAGPDVRSRFGEPSAPVQLSGLERNEMNPITYCMVVRETGKPSIIPRPDGYDERNYERALRSTPAFVDTAYPEGIYSGQGSVYTQRRLVDRYHNALKPGTEAVLLNWGTQDYPLFNLPRRVVDALEALEKGASAKNIVAMSYAERDVVFADAKRHALGFLYFLQTKGHERMGDYPQSFRYMELTPEFGSPDRLPWKPYIRESLRLEAEYMLHEQDVRATPAPPGANLAPLDWARAMPQDCVFGFQFSLDFHATRRKFLDDNPAGPWTGGFSGNRNGSIRTDWACFPYRSLVPVERDGLLGASKNIGVSSIVSSAVRLHGQTMHVGQAAGTAAALCVRHRLQPRALAANPEMISAIQQILARGSDGGLGVLLWPYHGLSPEDSWFVAANLLAVRGILPGRPGDLDFRGEDEVSRAETARVVVRAARSLRGARPLYRGSRPLFTDVAESAPDRPYIETLREWGAAPEQPEFRPGDPADWRTLADWMKALGWRVSAGLAGHDRRLGKASPRLKRRELAAHVWYAIQDQPQFPYWTTHYLEPGYDSDGDGIADLEDPLPFDRNNNNIPDHLEPAAR